MANKSPTTHEATALNIVIVGGSLAGLMHGIMLKQLGHHVHILERALSSTRGSQAAGITAGPHLQAFLKAYDIYTPPWFSLAPGVKVLDTSSKERMYRKMSLHNTSWDLLYYRMRAIFDAFESDHYPKTPLRGDGKRDGNALFECGKRVIEVVDAGATVLAEYEDLTTGVPGNVSADLVIVAGGASCNLRSMLLPQSDLHRLYSGYITWRGSVPERDVSKETRRIIGQENTLFLDNQSYLVVYTIPGPNGDLQPEDRTINFVWYCNCTEDALEDILTDINGHKHQYSLPPGKIKDSVWSAQKALAARTLPPPFLELLQKIQHPFVTAISDTAAASASCLNGKVLLVGDALTLFRPHNALGSNQAAFDCLQLKRVFQGEIDLSEWEGHVLQYARLNRLRAIAWGSYFLKGWLAYFASEIDFRTELVLQWATNRWYGRKV